MFKFIYADLLGVNDVRPMFMGIYFPALADAWVLGQVIPIYQSEVRYMSGANFGLRANTSHLAANQILTFSIATLCDKLYGVPRPWSLINSLLDIN